jgi:hypothetical protein
MSIYYIAIKTEKSGPDVGLATGDPDVRAFDLAAPFPSHVILLS